MGGLAAGEIGGVCPGVLTPSRPCSRCAPSMLIRPLLTPGSGPIGGNGLCGFAPVGLIDMPRSPRFGCVRRKLDGDAACTGEGLSSGLSSLLLRGATGGGFSLVWQELVGVYSRVGDGGGVAAGELIILELGLVLALLLLLYFGDERWSLISLNSLLLEIVTTRLRRGGGGGGLVGSICMRGTVGDWLELRFPPPLGPESVKF